MYLAVGLNLGLKFGKFHVLNVSNDLFEPWPFFGEPFLFELVLKNIPSSVSSVLQMAPACFWGSEVVNHCSPRQATPVHHQCLIFLASK
jgi:hypothetical protein